ncbi:MAG TPA: phenylalanine--tRNA ligase subunit beta, partial [Bacteroidales bacterium]|nr:phenylalanine--tRNA ligase subunit beta [Bacteroidales bacterium]
PDNEKLVDVISEYLTGCGFTEIMNNSLTKDAYYDNLNTFTSDSLVRIMNPLSNELNVMRQTLLFGGLETIRHNTNRQRPNLRLFEAGNCYTYHSERGKRNPLDKFEEHFQFALFSTGKKHEPNWVSSGDTSGFYELKAHLENMLEKMGINRIKLDVKPIDTAKDIYSGALRYRIGELAIAELAVIRKGITSLFDIKSDVYFAVIFWENLLKARGDHSIKLAELPRFPEVRRDLALIVDKSLTYDRIRDLAFRVENRLLRRVDLFDVYEGEQIGEGRKSYAVSFILQDTESTLTDDKIDRIVNRLMDSYVKELGAQIRK